MLSNLTYWLAPTRLQVEREGFVVSKGEKTLKAIVFEDVDHLEIGIDYSVRVYRKTVGGGPRVFFTQAFFKPIQSEQFLTGVYQHCPRLKGETRNSPEDFTFDEN